MLTLCGFAASNYYNKVKLALLEKDIPFEEELRLISGLVGSNRTCHDIFCWVC